MAQRAAGVERVVGGGVEERGHCRQVKDVFRKRKPRRGTGEWSGPRQGRLQCTGPAVSVRVCVCIE